MYNIYMKNTIKFWCSWIRRLNIIIISVLPNLIINNNQNFRKLFFRYLQLKFIQRSKTYRMVNTILMEQHKVGKLTLPYFKASYKTTVIKRVWFGQKNKPVDQWSRIETPEINPQNIVNTLWQRSRQNSGVKTIFSINGTVTTGY